MKPELFILLTATFLFGALCACAPAFALRKGRKRPEGHSHRKQRPEKRRVLLLRFLGLVIMVGVPALTFLTRESWHA